MEATKTKPNGERMVPMADDPVEELRIIRWLLREQRHEEAERRLTRILDWRLLEPRWPHP